MSVGSLWERFTTKQLRAGQSQKKAASLLYVSRHSIWAAWGTRDPLQCSCLENPRDGGAWWAAVHGVAQSRTRLQRLSSSSSRGTTVIVSPCQRPLRQYAEANTQGWAFSWVSQHRLKMLLEEMLHVLPWMHHVLHPVRKHITQGLSDSSQGKLDCLKQTPASKQC